MVCLNILDIECLDGCAPTVLDLEQVLCTEMAKTVKDRETNAELFRLELGEHYLASASYLQVLSRLFPKGPANGQALDRLLLIQFEPCVSIVCSHFTRSF
jgi:hypothetical protein